MAPEVTFEQATPAHAEALAPLMRAEDLAEVQAGGEASALDALLASLAGSEAAWAVLFDGEVGAMFGIGQRLPDGSAGCAWLLTGRAVSQHPMAFLRRSRGVLGELLERCGNLGNYVDARYTASVRWLRWLGAEFGQPEPRGPSGVLFYPVRFRRS